MEIDFFTGSKIIFLIWNAILLNTQGIIIYLLNLFDVELKSIFNQEDNFASWTKINFDQENKSVIFSFTSRKIKNRECNEKILWIHWIFCLLLLCRVSKNLSTFLVAKWLLWFLTMTVTMKLELHLYKNEWWTSGKIWSGFPMCLNLVFCWLTRFIPTPIVLFRSLW